MARSDDERIAWIRQNPEAALRRIRANVRRSACYRSELIREHDTFRSLWAEEKKLREAREAIEVEEVEIQQYYELLRAILGDGSGVFRGESPHQAAMRLARHAFGPDEATPPPGTPA